MTMPDYSCEQCRFWDFEELRDNHQMGFCRRYAPRPKHYFPHIPRLVNRKMETIWPMTYADDGCGEFEKGNDEAALD